MYFVVTKRAMMVGKVAGAKDVLAVFRDQREAEHFSLEESGEVEPRVVIGEISTPNSVFVASEYHPDTDLGWFLGLYGNFDLAKQAAGDGGEVLEVDVR
jgi:hypothetical protein